MGRRIVTPEKEQAVCDDIRAGLTRMEIIRKHGISQTIYYDIRSRQGFPSRFGDSHGSDKEMARAREEVRKLQEEEDRWMKEFHSRWKAAVRPIRDIRFQREKRKGVYW